MRAAFLSALTLGFLSFAGCERPVSASRQPTTDSIPRDSGITAFFGARARAPRDSVTLAFHARALYAMDEPSLSGRVSSGGVTVHRFTWLPFTNDAVVVRVTRSARGCEMVVKVTEHVNLLVSALPADEASAALRQYPIRRLRTDSVSVPPSTCAALAAQFSAMQLQAPGLQVNPAWLDGASWIHERLDSLGYTALDDWSPTCHTCAPWRAGRAFLDAAHALPVAPRVLY